MLASLLIADLTSAKFPSSTDIVEYVGQPKIPSIAKLIVNEGKVLQRVSHRYTQKDQTLSGLTSKLLHRLEPVLRTEGLDLDRVQGSQIRSTDCVGTKMDFFVLTQSPNEHIRLSSNRVDVHTS